MLYAEWINYLGWYRLFQPEHPEETVAYADNLGEETQAQARENGYTGIVERG